MDLEKKTFDTRNLEKAFEDIQHFFMIKTLNKLGREETSFIEYMWKTGTSYLMVKEDRTISPFPPKIRDKIRMSTFATSFQYWIGSIQLS